MVPCILLVIGCDRGDFVCTFEHFPWVSDIMGLFPNDKIYVFMMNLFTAVQFFTYRAYYYKIQDLTTPFANNFMLTGGYLTLIFGPLLALFDHFGKEPDPMADFRA